MFTQILLIGQGMDRFGVIDMIFSTKFYWKKVEKLCVIGYTRFVFIFKSLKNNKTKILFQ